MSWYVYIYISNQDIFHHDIKILIVLIFYFDVFPSSATTCQKYPQELFWHCPLGCITYLSDAELQFDYQNSFQHPWCTNWLVESIKLPRFVTGDGFIRYCTTTQHYWTTVHIRFVIVAPSTLPLGLICLPSVLQFNRSITDDRCDDDVRFTCNWWQ